KRPCGLWDDFSILVEQLIYFHDHALIIIVIILAVVTYIMIILIINDFNNRFKREIRLLNIILTRIQLTRTFSLSFSLSPKIEHFYIIHPSIHNSSNNIIIQCVRRAGS
ncbi:hypothetical protein L9F63_012228, partial [Diploptera punctata]